MPIVTTPKGCPIYSDYTTTHELYFDESLTEPFEFAKDTFQTVQKIYVKTILKMVGDFVPILREIELPYRHEEIDQ